MRTIVPWLNRPISFVGRVLATVTIVVVLLPPAAESANDTWNTTGTTVNWNLAGNWSGGLPSSTSTLVFGGDSAAGTAAGHVLNNDIVSLSIKGITFSAGAPAYTFNGNALTLTSNVTNSGTSLETINLNMATTAVRTFTMTSGGGDILLGGVISGALGGILTAGSGTLTLSGANTYTGTTTVAAGTTLKVTNSGSTTNGAVNNALSISSATLSGGTLQLRNDGAGGTGTGTVSYGNNVTVSASSTIDVNNVTSGVTNKTLSLGTLSVGAQTLNVTGGNGYGLAIGAVTLNTSAATSTFNPTTANLSLASVTNSLTSGQSATIALDGTSAGNAVTGIISNSGAGATTIVTKSNTSTWTLSGNNTYTGATSVTGGILNIQNGNALGATAAGTTVSSGATLQLQGGISVGAEALTISGTGASGQNGSLVNVSGTNNYGGLVTLGSASTISSDAGTLNLTNTGTITGSGFNLTLTGSGNGSISSIIGTGAATLTKSGSGTWTLTGANTYTGATTISAGALNIQNATGLGTTAAGTTVSSGAALQLQGGIGVGAEALTLNGSGVSNDGALRNISGNNSYGGAVTLGSDSTIASDAGTLTLSGTITNGGFATTFAGAGNITANGIISGTGSLVKNGSGTLTLGASNTFSGGATINGGMVVVSGGSLGPNTSAATINAGTLDVAATVSSSRNFALGNAASTVMVDPSQTFTATGVFSGTGALNKSGTGTLVVTGINTYSSGTAINAGTLLVNNSSGSGTGTGTVTVNNGGTLGGTGTITGGVIVNSGGTINPGPTGTAGTSAAVGTLHTGALTMTGGTAAFDISSTSNFDQLFVSGTVTLGTTATLQLSIAAGLNFIGGNQYTLIDNDGVADAISGAFSNAANGSTVTLGGYNFTINYAGGDGNDFVLTAVPEPSTWAAAVLALVAIGCSQHRRTLRKLKAETLRF